jgi:chemotaxis protein CheD
MPPIQIGSAQAHRQGNAEFLLRFLLTEKPPPCPEITLSSSTESINLKSIQMAHSFNPVADQMPSIIVGVADLKISTEPSTYLVTHALGSCLGVTFHDEKRRIGGLLHAMLPSASIHEGQKIRESMFLDTGIPRLLTALIRAGARKQDIRCKVFGGAQLMAADNYFRIGSKNIDMFYRLSHEMDLDVVAWEVSGRVNRSIRLNNQTGDVIVKIPSKPEFIR